MQRLEVIARTYYDSVTLMRVAKEITAREGVKSASLSMGTEANLRILAAGGFDLTGLEAGPNDLILAVAGEESVLEEALSTAKAYLANPPWRQNQDDGGTYRPRSLDGAVTVLPEANLAIVSVAGRYAGDVALECLGRDLNVMLYSDNVSLEK